jgi:hypothetical protein
MTLLCATFIAVDAQPRSFTVILCVLRHFLHRTLRPASLQIDMKQRRSISTQARGSGALTAILGALFSCPYAHDGWKPAAAIFASVWMTSRVYHDVRAADRAVFTLGSEFDAVRERLIC